MSLCGWTLIITKLQTSSTTQLEVIVSLTEISVDVSISPNLVRHPVDEELKHIEVHVLSQTKHVHVQ